MPIANEQILVMLSVVLGSAIGLYGALMVKIVHQHKNDNSIVYIRLLAACSVAIIGPITIYILKYINGLDSDLPLTVAIPFSVSTIIMFGVIFRRYNSDFYSDG